MEIINGRQIVDNGLIVTGSLAVSGSITGSLLGTASFATLALDSVNAPQPPSVKLFNYYNFI